jgi:N-acetylglucosaminyl-diphospho-decaprenol L-rhamnosyltransferase
VASALAAHSVGNVIVVDNASTDHSLAAIAPHPRLVRLENPVNVGFATAANQGWRVAAAEHVLLLNPDCVLGTQDVAALLAVLAEFADAGVVSAQLLNPDGSAQKQSLRRDPTPRRAIAEALGWQPAGIHIKPPAVPGIVAVEACSGALMLMPKSLLAALNGFDEGYFLHCEDLDLCRRVRQLNRQVLVDTRVRVVHDKGTSSAAVPGLVARAKHRGMLRYFEKFDAAQTAWPLRALVYAGSWLRYRVCLSGVLTAGTKNTLAP